MNFRPCVTATDPNSFMVQGADDPARPCAQPAKVIDRAALTTARTVGATLSSVQRVRGPGGGQADTGLPAAANPGARCP